MRAGNLTKGIMTTELCSELTLSQEGDPVVAGNSVSQGKSEAMTCAFQYLHKLSVIGALSAHASGSQSNPRLLNAEQLLLRPGTGGSSRRFGRFW